MSNFNKEFSEISFLKVSIAIPTYNRKRDVLECLESLQKLSYPNYEIIVVDNASTDGTAEAIRQRFPGVKLIRSDRNLGVTGGRNLGIKHSNGEYIFFLDHDTIVDKNVLSELVAVMRDDGKIGLAGPIVYYYDDPKRLWAAGASVNLITGKVSFNAASQIDNGQLGKLMEVQVLPTAFLVRVEVIDRIGLFDDTYFATYEDTDFSFRIREAGYKVVCISTAKVWHKVPLNKRESVAAVLRRAYFVARNRIIFMKKHSPKADFIIFLTFFMPVYTIYYTLLALKYFQPRYAVNYWRGVLVGLKYVV